MTDGPKLTSEQRPIQRAKSPAAPPHARTAAGEPMFKLQRLIGNQATARWIQAKLAVGPSDDHLEREADRVADQVMGMAEPAPIGSSPVALQRMCAACEHEVEDQAKQTIQAKRETAADAGATLDVPAAVRAAGRGGEPLPVPVRSFFESRFGRDFGTVRVHIDHEASQAARAVQARAYTVGRDIVFARGEYSPGTTEGRRLLAHELTHVVQQEQSAHALVQRAPCRSAAQCTTPTPGDIGPYRESVAIKQAEEEERLRRAPPGTPDAALLARHKTPATNVTSLVTSSSVRVPPEVHGIFIDAFMGKTASGQSSSCSDFNGGAPAGAPPDKSCIAVPATTEDDAKTILAKSVRSNVDKARTTEIAATVVHEGQHAHFDAGAGRAAVSAAADCNFDTVIFKGLKTKSTVEDYLSEMSAEIAEFAPKFQSFQSSPSAISQAQLYREERLIALDQNESINGIIQTLRCKCDCGTVDTFTTQVFDHVTGGWPADQKEEFQKAMTRILPAVWPKSLQKK